MTQNNPIVLLSHGVWHIVDHSRRAKTALCGRPITQRQAHSRLQTIGSDHVCPQCRRLYAPPDKTTR